MQIAALSSSLHARIAGKDLIVFDGECVLCSRFFQFVLKRDKAERFHFATAQSDLGQALYGALGLPLDDFETNLVIMDGQIYQHLDAVCAAVRDFGPIWRCLALVRFGPEWLKTRAYSLVARNRYRLFGRYETCMVPDCALKDRFL